MVPKSATTLLMQSAQSAARSWLQGGLRKKFNDLEKYKAAGVTAAIGFGLSHIPFVGPTLGKLCETGLDSGIDQVYKAYLDDSKTPKERMNNALFVLERYLCSSIRSMYNTLGNYVDTAPEKVQCKDCQDAFKEANALYLASECVTDLKKALALVQRLRDDMEGQIRLLELETQAKGEVRRRIENFRENHPNKACSGLHKCYWEQQPENIEFGTRQGTFSRSIT